MASVTAPPSQGAGTPAAAPRRKSNASRGKVATAPRNAPMGGGAQGGSQTNLTNPGTAHGQGQQPHMQTRKIWVYRNGDTHFAGRKVIVSDKRFKNFEQFLGTLTSDVGLTSGAVRKVYDAQGRRVESVNDLSEDGVYVAAGSEAYRPVAYPPQQPMPASGGGGAGSEYAATNPGSGADAGGGQPRGSISAPDYSGPRGQLSSSKKRWKSWHMRLPILVEKMRITAANPDDKPIFQSNSKGYRVAVFRNGDPLTPPCKLVLSYRNCRVFDQLLDELTRITRPKEGSVKRIYDADSFRAIRALQDLHDGQNLIACGTNEPARRAAYPLVDFAAPTELRRITQLAAEPPRVITVYPNGDALHTGVKVAVTRYRFRDLRRLLDFVGAEVPLFTGRAGALYTTAGSRVESLDQVQHGADYVVAAGRDPFQAIRYNADGYRRPAPAAAAAPQHTLHTMSRANELLEKSKKLLQARQDAPPQQPQAQQAQAQAQPQPQPPAQAPAPAPVAKVANAKAADKPAPAPQKAAAPQAPSGIAVTLPIGGGVVVTAKVSERGLEAKAQVKAVTPPAHDIDEEGDEPPRDFSPAPGNSGSNGSSNGSGVKTFQSEAAAPAAHDLSFRRKEEKDAPRAQMLLAVPQQEPRAEQIQAKLPPNAIVPKTVVARDDQQADRCPESRGAAASDSKDAPVQPQPQAQQSAEEKHEQIVQSHGGLPPNAVIPKTVVAHDDQPADRCPDSR